MATANSNTDEIGVETIRAAHKSYNIFIEDITEELLLVSGIALGALHTAESLLPEGYGRDVLAIFHMLEEVARKLDCICSEADASTDLYELKQKSPTASVQKFSDGAIFAMQILQALERMPKRTELSDGSAQDSLDGEVQLTQAAKNMIIGAMGNLSPYQAGFVTALSEYIWETISVGFPNLDVWVPESAMTPSELGKCRAEMLRDIQIGRLIPSNEPLI